MSHAAFASSGGHGHEHARGRVSGHHTWARMEGLGGRDNVRISVARGRQHDPLAQHAYRLCDDREMIGLSKAENASGRTFEFSRSEVHIEIEMSGTVRSTQTLVRCCQPPKIAISSISMQ